MESALPLDVPAAAVAFPVDEITPGKALLFPVGKMLSKMIEYPEAAREKMAGYGSQDAPGMDNSEQEQEQEQES